MIKGKAYLNICLLIYVIRLLEINHSVFLEPHIFAIMFSIKNYYAILQVEPSASIADIKKAYRRLALKYHPDKNNNDSYSSAQFAEIKEAYEVLTDPAKKEYYLQQRWYNQSMGYQKTQGIVTPVSLLKQSLELEKYVSRLDVFRMDKEKLKDYLMEMLSDDVIDKIKAFNEHSTTKSIIAILLKTIQPLSSEMSDPVIRQLFKLADQNESEILLIKNSVANTQKRDRLEKYKPLVILFFTLLICGLIWLMSR